MPAVFDTLADSRASDASLVARILNGDHDAFAILMRRHNRLLFRTARSIVHSDADAEDVLQNAYLKAYRKLADFRGDSALSTWLTRLVINEALMRLRGARRGEKVVQLASALPNNENEDGTLKIDSIASADDGPIEHAMRGQMRVLLERAIDALPDNYRTVFMLREVEELEVEDVAAALDIPEATVRTRHFRGRARLRDILLREAGVAVGDAFSFDGARCERIVAGVLARL